MLFGRWNLHVKMTLTQEPATGRQLRQVPVIEHATILALCIVFGLLQEISELVRFAGDLE